MPDKPEPYYGTWINRQRSLLPGLHEELDPLTDRLERLIVILDTRPRSLRGTAVTRSRQATR